MPVQDDTPLARRRPDRDPDPGTPGWDAINEALAALYPGQAPRHFGAALPWTLGGDTPLDGISVYRSELPRPHWHYVTFGFSELFGKQSDDPDVSGFGFELTFRLAVPAGTTTAATPPSWPMDLLQNLARYVFDTGNVFEPGHYMNANGPIALDHDTVLRHLAFMDDPQLAPRRTPNGHLRFLQAIGLADGEMAAVLRWSTQDVLRVLEPAMPLWMTDLARADLLDDPALAAKVEAGSRRDGSSTAAMFAATLDWSRPQPDGPVELVLGASQVPGLLQLLQARLPAGETLEVSGPARCWVFAPGPHDTVRLDGDTAYCTLGAATLQALPATVRAQRGRYPLGDGRCLLVDVHPSTLRDGSGATVGTVG